jgi:hypothetical protein
MKNILTEGHPMLDELIIAAHGAIKQFGVLQQRGQWDVERLATALKAVESIYKIPRLEGGKHKDHRHEQCRT